MHVYSGSYIGLHQQDPHEQWDLMHNHAYLADNQFRLLKDFHPETYLHLQAVSPGTAFIFRHHIEDSHQGAFVDQAGLGTVQANAAADGYIQQFSDSVNQHMGADDNEDDEADRYAESLNEEYPTRNPEKLAKIVAFDRAFVRRLPILCPGIKPIVFTAAVGNPDHHEYGALVDLARETAAAGGAFGYHGYWTVHNGQSFVNNPGVGRDLHMRWEVIDEYLVSQGIRVKWMLGEVGATKGNADGYNPDVIEGWKSSAVWGGNEDAYLADIANFDELLAGTLAAREGRLIGATLFTSRPGDGGTWRYFNVTGSMAWKVASYVGSKVAPPPEPEPEPEPMNWKKEIIEESKRRTAETGINFNPTFAFIRWMAENGYSPANSEGSYTTSDGVKRQLQGAKDLRGVNPDIYFTYAGAWAGMSNVEILTDEDAEEDPLPFAFRAWPTDYKVITQIAGNNTAYYGQIAPSFAGHEGLDIRAPMGAPVYSVDSGVVSDLRQAGDAGHAYGRFIRVRHSDGYESTYGHLHSIGVVVGQQVSAGQEIGRADNTGNIVSGASHLHLTLKKDGVIVDPTPFALPHKPDFPGLPPSSHGVTVCDVSTHQGAIDFRKMLRRGVHGAYIRASIGGTGQDLRFTTNWPAAERAGLKRGMYHLFRSDSTAQQNLDNVRRMVDAHGAGDWRIAVDVEPVTNLPRVNGDRVRQFVDLFVDEFGYQPLVYTGNWVISGRTDGDKTWAATSLLWLAAYWTNPPQTGQFPQLPAGNTLDRLLMHQWTSSYYSGAGFGVGSSGVDVNVVYDLGRLAV